MTEHRGSDMAVASVVIPAHNESASIARTLAALATGVEPGDLEVVVVANGCSDRTAQIARSANPPVRVRKIGQASKSEAVRVGNATASVFPRVHLDADIELTGADVLRLVQPLAAGEVHATAPRRVVPAKGARGPSAGSTTCGSGCRRSRAGSSDEESWSWTRRGNAALTHCPGCSGTTWRCPTPSARSNGASSPMLSRSSTLRGPSRTCCGVASASSPGTTRRMRPTSTRQLAHQPASPAGPGR